MSEMSRLAFDIGEMLRNRLSDKEIIEALVARGFPKDWATKEVAEARKCPDINPNVRVTKPRVPRKCHGNHTGTAS